MCHSGSPALKGWASPLHADLTKIAKDVSTAAGSDIDADLTKIAKDVSGIVNYVEGTNEE